MSMSPPPYRFKDEEQWAAEQDILTAREATKSAIEMSKAVLTSLLTINGGGIVITLGLFGHFVTAAKQFNPDVLQSLFVPGALFAAGMVMATTSAFCGYVAELNRSNIFPSPWEHLEISLARNEKVMRQTSERASTSRMNFRIWLWAAVVAAALSLACFLIGLWVLTGAVGELKPIAPKA